MKRPRNLQIKNKQINLLTIKPAPTDPDILMIPFGETKIPDPIIDVTIKLVAGINPTSRFNSTLFTLEQNKNYQMRPNY